jgi:hypothetical protein
MAQHGPTLSPDLIYVTHWQFERYLREEQRKRSERFYASVSGKVWFEKYIKAFEREEWRAWRDRRQLEALNSAPLMHLRCGKRFLMRR